MTMSNNSFNVDSFWDEIFDVNQLFVTKNNWLSNDINNQNHILINDEYQQTLSLSMIDHDQSTSNNLSPRKQIHQTNLICRVCGAPACGHNFNQITCESCKAFFRRNALRHRPNLKCRFNESCVIDIYTRRQCAYCRLKKCFDINMRKDWIRTDQEIKLRQWQKLVKQQKKSNQLTDNHQSFPNLSLVARTKKRLTIIKTTDQNLINKFIPRHILNVHYQLYDDDRIRLNNIHNAYQSISEQALAVRHRQHTLPSTLIKFINNVTEIHESLINYYKLLPEFKQLTLDNQILLIKSNLVKLIHLHCVLIDQFQDNNNIGDCMEKWISVEFHREMTRAYRYSHHFIEHPLILKLTLIIFIFTIELSIRYNEENSNDYYTDKDQIHLSQDFYTTLLWRYLITIYNEKQAIQSMNIIVTQILRYQVLMDIMEDVIRQQANHEPVNQLEISLFRLTC